MASRRNWFGLLIGFVLTLCLLSVVAVAASYVLSPIPTPAPVVVIHSPESRAKLTVGQLARVYAVARDEYKVKRVELWVDGQLQEAQSSVQSGGVSSLPLLANWRPTSPGVHTVMVRAFNARGGRSHASMDMEAIPSADGDGDTIPDAIDACPDQPGLPTGRGCAVASTNDGDGDSLPDSLDACPAQPGVPSADGCPDADTDGVRDSADTCPQAAGSTEGNGCPGPGDSDGDEIADASDACPEEPGPASARGCPDGDRDGVRDQADACPGTLGPTERAGCPDRDADGVRDALNLCLDAAGPESNSGCPVSSAGDRDGDGVHDDIDLSPDEPGLAAHGGSPPPGQGADRNNNSLPDDLEAPEQAPTLLGLVPLPRLLLDLSDRLAVPQEKYPEMVEFQALEFEAADAGYTGVYCYAAGGGYSTRFPSDPSRYFYRMGPTRWVLPDELASRFVLADTENGLQVSLHCNAAIYHSGGDRPEIINLGAFTLTHFQESWDGRVITMWPGHEDPIAGATINSSENPAPGHYFQVKYRLCRGTCAGAAAMPAPGLWAEGQGLGTRLHYSYSGVQDEVNGFELFVNGRHQGYLERGITDASGVYDPPDSMLRTCGEDIEFQVLAFRGNPTSTHIDSPRSNTVVVPGVPCSHRVRVTFETIGVTEITEDDEREESGVVGPIRGFFSAGPNSSSSVQLVEFDAADCSWQRCRGYRFRSHSYYAVEDIIGFIDSTLRSCLGDCGFGYGYGGSYVNYVDVLMDEDDWLLLGGYIVDEDRSRRGGEDDVMFDEAFTLSPEEIARGTYRMVDDWMPPNIDVQVRLQTTHVP